MKSILQYYVGVLSGLRLTDLFYFDMNLDNIFIWAQHIHIFIKLCVSEKIVTETDNRSIKIGKKNNSKRCIFTTFLEITGFYRNQS